MEEHHAGGAITAYTLVMAHSTEALVIRRTIFRYTGEARRPSAEAVEAPKFLSDCHTGPECRESPSGFSRLDRKSGR